LTKLYEETRRDTLDALAAHYAKAGPPKGEAVVVVGPPVGDAAAADLDAMLSQALDGMSVRDAAAAISTASGRPRREVYARALEIAAARREAGK
jgi:16S rRNA (cytidine1402-2'-O)-methyltransferase